MDSATDFNTTPCTPIIGDVENDIPLDTVLLSGEIESDILDDLDAQLEDECLDSIWAV
ncbi:hypothetical protein [Acidithiobacillus sp.]|nr:hypothetical protein [Planctomycetia bacterium]